MRAFATAGGESYLVTVAKNQPQVFCALLGKVLPTQVTGKDGEPLLKGIQVSFVTPEPERE